MKKETKKKLEHELNTAIEMVLIKLNSKAVAKTKKAIRQSSKAVVKKFSKAIKALDARKKPLKTKGKTAKSKSSKKTYLARTSSVKHVKVNKVVADLTKSAEIPRTVDSQGTEPQNL
jgi:hypothetical protein